MLENERLLKAIEELKRRGFAKKQQTKYAKKSEEAPSF